MQTVTIRNTPAAKAAIAQSPYAGQIVTKAPNWTGLTAWDILFNNLSIGTFLVAVTGSLLAGASFAPLVVLAYPLALVLLVIDLALLISDLGDPWRFHHMLRVVKPSSPMSVGTWSLTFYGIALGFAAVVAVLHWPLFASLRTMGWLWGLLEFVGAAAALLAIVPAMGGILYKGVLFSITAQPGWKDARWLGGYVTNSAILLGSAILLIVAVLAGASQAAAILRAAMLGLIPVDVVLCVLLYRGVAPAAGARFTPNARRMFWLSVIVVGWLLPSVILWQGSRFELIPPLLVIISALAVRLAFVTIPHKHEEKKHD
jgi:hypothetical protein